MPSDLRAQLLVLVDGIMEKESETCRHDSRSSNTAAASLQGRISCNRRGKVSPERPIHSVRTNGRWRPEAPSLGIAACIVRPAVQLQLGEYARAWTRFCGPTEQKEKRKSAARLCKVRARALARFVTCYHLSLSAPASFPNTRHTLPRNELWPGVNLPEYLPALSRKRGNATRRFTLRCNLYPCLSYSRGSRKRQNEDAVNYSEFR